MLDLTKSTYYPAFNRLCKEAAAACTEANDNVRHATPPAGFGALPLPLPLSHSISLSLSPSLPLSLSPSLPLSLSLSRELIGFGSAPERLPLTHSPLPSFLSCCCHDGARSSTSRRSRASSRR